MCGLSPETLHDTTADLFATAAGNGNDRLDHNRFKGMLQIEKKFTATSWFQIIEVPVIFINRD
jgi:hypothetical protein